MAFTFPIIRLNYYIYICILMEGQQFIRFGILARGGIEALLEKTDLTLESLLEQDDITSDIRMHSTNPKLLQLYSPLIASLHSKYSNSLTMLLLSQQPLMKTKHTNIPSYLQNY